MIEIKNLSFQYINESPLFDGLDVEFKKGSICGLLGKNGVGKTTLLKLIAGLLFQDKGKITLNGHAPKNRSPSFLENIFFIPEEFYLPNLSGIAYQKLYSPFYRHFDKQLFDNSTQKLELDLHQMLPTLSFGQKKKFIVAFGLATNCKIFLFDEPTNGLDIPSKSQFRELITSVLDEHKTVILSTHQVRDIANLIDPIVILEKGRVIFDQSIESISKKIAFYYELPALDTKSTEILYSEHDYNGYKIVTPNIRNDETLVDIELLFNAVVQNSIRVQKLFS